MTGRWMIYGANGFTGRLVAAEAVRRGLAPVLAGRSVRAITKLGSELGLDARVFSLDRIEPILTGLSGISVVLNCAGPFSRTSRPMLDACVRSAIHYLDITGEWPVLEATYQRHGEFQDAGIAVVPAVGFDVVPTDCLVARLKQALPNASHLAIAVSSPKTRISPGTARTILELSPAGNVERWNGTLVDVPFAHKVRRIAFDAEPQMAISIPLADQATAFYTTGIPNVETYVGVSEREWQLFRLVTSAMPLVRQRMLRTVLQRLASRVMTGPSGATQAEDSATVWCEVSNGRGNRVAERMRTPEPYRMTALTAVRAVEALLATKPMPGAATPTLAFGIGFAESVGSVSVAPA